MIFAAGLVDIDAAARQHGDSVPRLEFPEAMRGAECHHFDLGFAFLQREIVVAAGGEFEAGDFPGHRDIGKLAVQSRSYGAVEFGDAEYAALRKKVEPEFELLHYRMVARYFFTERITPSGEEAPETVALIA